MNIGAGFEAVFIDPVGRAVQQRWADAAVAVAFEDLDPVSAFPVVPGRRWGPGLWWSTTTRRHVAAGSNAMRIQLMVLDRAPDVTGLAGRPVRLLWRDGGGRVRSWVPQLFARYRDGTALLADCPSRPDTGGERALAAAEAVSAACEEVGWSYRRLAPLDEVPAANLKWLAGYRHPRHRGRTGLLEAVVDEFERPRPLVEGVAAVGDPIEVLPVAFHALWAGLLEAAIDVTLHERVLVHAPASGGGSGLPGARDSSRDGFRAGAGIWEAG
ncbi:TnsA-like heteromeric transposase endonuclease subunit [Streptomyces sp. NPDC056007]|uniref:TnsA-like heteromeric transposase endonuclease subunit n=1 Tax=Streptomyces sp. NPDC056007 TaxID=3345678 RepID=UPI0035DDC7D3